MTFGISHLDDYDDCNADAGTMNSKASQKSTGEDREESLSDSEREALKRKRLSAGGVRARTTRTSQNDKITTSITE